MLAGSPIKPRALRHAAPAISDRLPETGPKDRRSGTPGGTNATGNSCFLQVSRGPQACCATLEGSTLTPGPMVELSAMRFR